MSAFDDHKDELQHYEELIQSVMEDLRVERENRLRAN